METGRGREEAEVRNELHWAVFYWFLQDRSIFYWTREQERGTRKRNEVEQYSSRPAREYRTEGESRRAA